MTISIPPLPERRFSLLRGLSGKVLALTILFVLLGEVLIFLPSIANFRIQWLKGRIAQAEIAALAAEAAPNQILNDKLRTEILKGAGVVAVSLKQGETRRLVLRDDEDVMVVETFDLRPGMGSYFLTVGEALSTMFRANDRVIGVIDKPPNMSGDLIEIALHEQPLQTAMRGYALNILLLSIFLSLIVAGLIFAALRRVLVQPMQRLTANMLAFAAMPEDPSRIIRPSHRQDEIGMAERELKSMQSQLAATLNQKNHLAALGLAVSKVSHDLRNMLTSAQLISDRLGGVNDPTVQRFAPKLIASLDRAINFLSQTLTYGRAQELPPERESLELSEIADEVLESAMLQAPAKITLRNLVPRGIKIDADREHISRILTNLVRNALQALDQQDQSRDGYGQVVLGAQRGVRCCIITVADTGPGIPEAIRPKLFQAFQTAARPGGTGLGLAIAAELVQAHGGTIVVSHTGPDGTSILVTIPDFKDGLVAGRESRTKRAG
jgi:signal transduction histidine kinase